MPLYQFQCKQCEEQFEEQIKLEDIVNDSEGRAISICPKCQSPAVRIITNPRHYKHLSWTTWRANDKD